MWNQIWGICGLGHVSYYSWSLLAQARIPAINRCLKQSSWLTSKWPAKKQQLQATILTWISKQGWTLFVLQGRKIGYFPETYKGTRLFKHIHYYITDSNINFFILWLKMSTWQKAGPERHFHTVRERAKRINGVIGISPVWLLITLTKILFPGFHNRIKHFYHFAYSCI